MPRFAAFFRTFPIFVLALSCVGAAAATLTENFTVSVGGANSISPATGGSISALGHTWSFLPIQDAFSGNDLLKDGNITSLHGQLLTWDGATLTVTWHHPYPFDPATGNAWTPPLFTASVDAETLSFPGGD